MVEPNQEEERDASLCFPPTEEDAAGSAGDAPINQPAESSNWGSEEASNPGGEAYEVPSGWRSVLTAWNDPAIGATLLAAADMKTEDKGEEERAELPGEAATVANEGAVPEMDVEGMLSDGDTPHPLNCGDGMSEHAVISSGGGMAAAAAGSTETAQRAHLNTGVQNTLAHWLKKQ